MNNSKELVKVAKRENNKKRNFLIVNPQQGKHVPVSPTRALELFKKLSKQIENKYSSERLLLVGFAETATAIGSQVAIELGAKYIQTTREKIDGVEYLFFSEEHSHATEQKLIKSDIDAAISKIDRVVFVEDEVTTGKTILNIISVLDKAYENKISYTVLSILNGMSEENMQSYREKNIDIFYIHKLDNSNFSELVEQFDCNGSYYKPDLDKKIEINSIFVNGAINARRIIYANQYEEACTKLYQSVEKFAGIGDRVLVVGTEEFMFPALYVGSCFEKKGCEVLCHSTTRSPILVSGDENYPLHARYELRSLYDSERVTYLYDIEEYDVVIVLTDANDIRNDSINSLINALGQKNKNINLVRWIP